MEHNGVVAPKMLFPFKYILNIKNCITLSDFGCVEIYIDHKSLLVWMEIELRILYFTIESSWVSLSQV